MAIWDKLRSEIDRAGRAAQGALDEGKVRLELFRARQSANRAAQALGYAVHRARVAGTGLDEATLERLHGALTSREAEVGRLEEDLRAAERAGSSETAAPPPAASTPPPSNPAGV